MTSIPRSRRRFLIALMAFCGWTLLVGFEPVRAATVVSTLSLPNEGTFPGEQVGAAVQIGSTPIILESVVYTQTFTNGPVPGETFAIFSRNADGTVGSSLFTDFTLSFDSTSQNTTATANSSFTFQANTSYWLMMVETPGTFGEWDYSEDFTYTSNFGVTIPETNTSVSFFEGSYAYANLDEGLQLFQLNGTPIAAIPEPSTLALASTAGVIVLGVAWRRRRS
jgi:hypothetical protein